MTSNHQLLAIEMGPISVDKTELLVRFNRSFTTAEMNAMHHALNLHLVGSPDRVELLTKERDSWMDMAVRRETSEATAWAKYRELKAQVRQDETARDDARDAARYRWLRDTGAVFAARAAGANGTEVTIWPINRPAIGLDQAVDHHLSQVEPECQHDLLKPNTTIEVIDKWKAKCTVCIEFFDLPGRPEKASEVEILRGQESAVNDLFKR